MENTTQVNLAACLRSTSTVLSEVANGLGGLNTDDEIARQAEILDRIAEDASEGAAILRAVIVRHERESRTLPRRVPDSIFTASRVPSDLRGSASSEDAKVTENLELLRREWDHAYVIWFQAAQYCACRRDNAAICRRPKAEDLRREVETDYQACPVLA